jgi:hypothetical protein
VVVLKGDGEVSALMTHTEFDEALLRSLLDRPIAFNRTLVPVAGSITAALLLAQIIYWQTVMLRLPERRDGWFYKTAGEWYAETGMTRSEFEGARARLLKRGLVSYEVRGNPPVGYYRVEFDELVSNLRKTCKSICEKPATRTAENLQSELRETSNPHITTKTTTEITSENTTETGVAALKSRKSVSREPPLGFLEFWVRYPRKVSKVAAERAWRALAPDRELQAMMLAVLEVQTRSEQWTKRKGKYVPYPATWINERRWEDEEPVPPGLTRTRDYRDGVGADGRF